MARILMANKPRKVNQTGMEEVFTAFNLLLLQNPEGTGPTDVWEAFFKGRLSSSWVSSNISELERQGYIRFVGIKDKRKKYLSTGKELNITTKPVSPPKPSEPLFTPTNPEEPHEWREDLEKVISGLELLQAAIPGLKAGLLDLTKNLERLGRVKEIIGDLAKVARRNV